MRNIKTLALSSLLCFTACATTDDESSTIDTPVLATLAGSRLAADLGVTTWKVHADGNGARILGLDADGERRAELLAHPDATSAELVHVESVFPDRGRFDLTRAGIVDKAASPGLVTLARAIGADMGEHSVEIPDDGQIESALTQQNEGIFQVGWAFFPHWNNILVGSICTGQVKHHVNASAQNGAATCSPNGWLNGSQADDCRTFIHYSIGGFSNDTCRWAVFVN
jgi:hypothetical protein